MYFGAVALPPLNGRQKEVLYLSERGHTVVLGTAGSGKTTLAVYRAIHLANTKLPHAGRVLLLSFNNALLRYFESISEIDTLNVDLRTYHRFARGYLKARGKMRPNAIATNDEREQFVKIAVEELDDGSAVYKRPLTFLAEEVRWIAQHGITTASEYVNCDRTGRQGTRLQRRDRAPMFAIYRRHRELRQASGRDYDWDDIASAVCEEARSDSDERMYRHIVIDEGQDFSPMMLRSLAALVPDGGSLIFFGDMAQQIYGNKMSWRHAGLDVRTGGEWRFEQNYRNTRQIAELALAIAGMSYYSGTPDLVSPVTPTADGPRPSLVKCKSRKKEFEFVAATAGRLARTQSVAILMRTRDEESELRECLPSDINIVRLHKKMTAFRGTGLYYGTYAAAKGLEFDAVFLPRLDASALPFPEDVANYGDDDAATIAGKHLYVAVTRARTQLVLTHSETLTMLLPVADLYDRTVA